MNFRAILLHFRLPFSILLMPVFWFAMSQTTTISTSKSIWLGIILHLLLYPASNAYNSYFDKDEGSIGGLEKPPAVDKKLFITAWIVDVIALVLTFVFISPLCCLALFIYGMVSKAYSHSAIRLKKYPFISWIVVGFFQGFFIYITVIQAITNVSINELLQVKYCFPALLSSMMLWAVYPITQVYQHKEDQKRGDKTLSIVLGIRGTFLFTMSVFGIAFTGFYLYFSLHDFLLMLVMTTPTLVFFLNWLRKVWNHPQEANFKQTMWLNILASLGLNLFYITLFFMR